MKHKEFWDEKLVQLIENQERLGGIDVKKLPPGCHLRIRTENSQYTMTPAEDGQFTLKGGVRFPEPTLIQFRGSTWGGSMIKNDWIGNDMHMELVLGQKVYLTSPIQGAEIVGPDWSFTMEWASSVPLAITG